VAPPTQLTPRAAEPGNAHQPPRHATAPWGSSCLPSRHPGQPRNAKKAEARGSCGAPRCCCVPEVQDARQRRQKCDSLQVSSVIPGCPALPRMPSPPRLPTDKRRLAFWEPHPRKIAGRFSYPESPCTLHKHSVHLSTQPASACNAFLTTNQSTGRGEALTWGYLGRRQRSTEKQNRKTGFI